MEKPAICWGLASLRVQGNLERFKQFIERSGTESVAWRDYRNDVN
jgi:hypothetical protein